MILQAFEAYLLTQEYADLTRQGYLADVRQFITWFEQSMREPFALEDLTPTDFRSFRHMLQEGQHCKASTVNRKLAALHELVRWGQATGQLAHNPMESVKSVKQMPTGIRWLTKQEQFALQRAFARDLQLSQLKYPKRWLTRRRDVSLGQFLLNTGLRLNEALAVEVSDLELSARRGMVWVRQGKGNKQRQVPLNQVAREAVQVWLAVRPVSSSPYMWITVEGPPEKLSGRTVQRMLQRYAEEAKIEALTPHICRHTFAKNLINQGIGLEKVAALLGHANLNTTRLYITPDAHDLENAVETLVP